MSKKFDVVIGNPPYQEEAQGGGTRDTPIYHLFMDAAYEVGKKAVLITPARFLFNAGPHPEGVEREDARRPPPDASRITFPTATICSPARPSTAASPSPTGTRTATASPSARSRIIPELNTILQRWSSRHIVSMRVGHHEFTLLPLHREAVRRQPRCARASTGRQTSLGEHERVRAVRFPLPRRPTPRRSCVRPCAMGSTGGSAPTAGFAATTSQDRRASTSTRSSLPHLAVTSGRSARTCPRRWEPLSAEPEVAVTQTFITIGAFDDQG